MVKLQQPPNRLGGWGLQSELVCLFLSATPKSFYEEDEEQKESENEDQTNPSDVYKENKEKW